MPLPPRIQWKLDRWRERISGMFGGREEQPRPRLCPNCGTLVGSTASRCHECGTSLTFSLAAASRSLSGLLPTDTPVTYAILGLNGLMFALTIVISMRMSQGGSGFGVSGPALFLLGARESHAIFAGDWWRLVMPIFLHGGLMHIFFNTWVLMDLGPQIEELYGSARYLFLYVTTGIFSFIVSTAWSIFAHGGVGISIGASGALMGLIGLMLGITSGRSSIVMQTMRRQLIKWVLYITIIGLLTATDNAAHFGGLAAGYVFGRVMDDRPPSSPEEHQRANLLGWGAALVVIASFAFMILNFFRIQP